MQSDLCLHCIMPGMGHDGIVHLPHLLHVAVLALSAGVHPQMSATWRCHHAIRGCHVTIAAMHKHAARVRSTSFSQPPYIYLHIRHELFCRCWSTSAAVSEGAIACTPCADSSSCEHNLSPYLTGSLAPCPGSSTALARHEPRS